jgi:serine/threonine-protein kinase PknG
MTTCAQAGCSGTIEDGYCGTCGMAPAGVPTAASKTEPMKNGGPSAASQGSARTTPGSGRTGSSRSGRTPSTRSARSTRSTRSTHSGSTRSGRTGSRAVGARPLARPPLPPLDPLAAIVPGVVPERKRICSGCDAPLKRESGFCPKCGQEYSFKPSLQPGDLVADKYEIKGTIAFGGLGWIYLALDVVLNRWVILKGLLNSKDPKMLEVAVQEREFLAAVKHPNIVSIYDFVTHGTEGFIVMEYVNGKSLMTLRKERGEPLPVPEAISYIAEILPALGYLDEMGLVYCDFKPENVMVEEETVKLIDLGAVRQVDATGGDIYGSRGYTAPEAHDAPTPVSDLYSVGRALAVLVASFDFQGKYETSLPSPNECPSFEKNDALYKFLLKSTRPKADERFQTASEMGEQLVGVLFSILGESSDLGKIESMLFESDSDKLSSDSAKQHRTDGVPRLKVDKGDAAANVILAAGAVSDPDRRRMMFERALKQHPDSIELKLRLVDELVTLGKHAQGEKLLEEVQKGSPNDWRVAWYRGRALLAQGKIQETLAAFQSILDELPGELAPRQALARTYEEAGAFDRAVSYYDAVSRADSSFVSAALGLARCLEKMGDRVGAAAAYRRVPPTSSRYPQAQMALARLLLRPKDGNEPTVDELTQASLAIESLDGLTDGIDLHLLRAELFSAAATHQVAKTKALDTMLLKVPLREVDMRRAAETEYRTCARMAPTDDERWRLVDRANGVRPLTLT